MSIDQIIEAQKHQAVADMDGPRSQKAQDWLYDFFADNGAEVLELCYKQLWAKASGALQEP
jgi:hypothetical protein